MEPPTQIFRQYDIRGIVGEDLLPATARAVGQAYGTALREVRGGEGGRRPGLVAVGADNRPSSPELRDALATGLTEAGADVLDLGTVPTPVTYWAEYRLGADGTIQITGSHNPPEWNGIKMTMGRRPYFGEDIAALRERIVAGTLARGKGRRKPADILDGYVEDISRRFRTSRPIRTVVDAGNGTGSLVAERLLGGIGADVIPLYCDSDGTFPNHHPDPAVEENLADLVRAVREEEADVGIAFDGDADRIGIVDEKGRILAGDLLLLLLGLDLLSRHGPGKLLVYDVKCSQALPEAFEAGGGRALMWKTGHSYIKEKMRETGAAIGGELSGHICFADDYIGTDDALYAACRLTSLLADSDRPLSELTESFPHYASTPEIRLQVTEEVKTRIVDRAAAYFRDRREVVDVDGVRILFGDGWALLRASNTQPVLVARFEARSRERLREIRGEVEGWLRGEGINV